MENYLKVCLAPSPRNIIFVSKTLVCGSSNLRALNQMFQVFLQM